MESCNYNNCSKGQENVRSSFIVNSITKNIFPIQYQLKCQHCENMIIATLKDIIYLMDKKSLHNPS